MAITNADLRFYRSERMTQEADAGGRMSSVEIVSGIENSVFDDISDISRATGSLHIAKIYAAVTSLDTDKYLDAAAALFKAPADPNVRVLLTSTGSFYDERSDIAAYLETYLVRGVPYIGYLYGTHAAGTRSVTFFGTDAMEVPTINNTLCLVQYTSSAHTSELHAQYVRIIRIVSNKMVQAEDGDEIYWRRVIECEIASPLTNTFYGSYLTKYNPLSSSQCYETVPADSAQYNGIRPLVAEAVSGNLSVYTDSIYDRLVPVSQTESAVLDANAATNRVFTTPGSASSISFTTGDNFSASFTLYIGRAFVPGSLVITVSGGTLVDNAGKLFSGTQEIGTVSYTDGTVIFAATSPLFSGAKTVEFVPAGVMSRPSNSFGIPIGESNRALTYVANLSPIPNKGTLQVDYMSKGNWYRLSDNGNGILVGASQNYGAGTIRFDTGSLSITLGAYPDFYSSIIVTYGSGADTLTMSGAGSVAFTLQFSGALVQGTCQLAWGTFLLDIDNSMGTLSGTGGSAVIDYSTGLVTVIPDTIPAVGTVFTLTGTRVINGGYYSEQFNPTNDNNGVISIALSRQDFTALSVKYTIQANAAELPTIEDDWTLLDTRPASVGWTLANGWLGGAVGTADSAAGTFTMDTDGVFLSHQVPVYIYVATITPYIDENGDYGTQVIPVKTFSHWETVNDIGGRRKEGSVVSVYYVTSPTTEAITDTATLSSLSFATNRPSSNWSYVPGAVQILIGDRTYSDIDGRMIYGFNSTTGLGTDAGSFDANSGTVNLTDWPVVTNTYMQSSGLARQTLVVVSRCVFRTPSAPVVVSSFSFRVTGQNGGTVTGAANAEGKITGTYCDGRIDYQTGVVDLYFGEWVIAEDYMAEQWYSAEAIRTDGKILRPFGVKLDTLLYNCVTYSILPMDARALGIDAVRIPADGLVPIFKDGQIVLVHNTQTIAENSLSPTQVIDCGRTRLYRATIEDVNGVRLLPEYFTVDRELGTVTMKPVIDLTGLTAPYTVSHTVADLSRIGDADLSGRINLTKAVSHTYPANTSYLSGLAYIGTLQARVTALFAQSTWTSVWQDSLIGTEPLAQFNDAQYPLVVTNQGAYPDRYLIKFTSSTEFQVIGENLGFIGIGDTSTDCSTLNSLTGIAYFTIPFLGWGLGWATGNCLRFNIVSASYPIDLIRAIQPSNPTGADSDSVELIFVGNVDR